MKNKLPDGNFSSLIKVLKEFLSFMNMAVSDIAILCSQSLILLLELWLLKVWLRLSSEDTEVSICNGLIHRLSTLL